MLDKLRSLVSILQGRWGAGAEEHEQGAGGQAGRSPHRLKRHAPGCAPHAAGTQCRPQAVQAPSSTGPQHARSLLQDALEALVGLHGVQSGKHQAGLVGDDVGVHPEHGAVKPAGQGRWKRGSGRQVNVEAPAPLERQARRRGATPHAKQRVQQARAASRRAGVDLPCLRCCCEE